MYSTSLDLPGRGREQQHGGRVCVAKRRRGTGDTAGRLPPPTRPCGPCDEHVSALAHVLPAAVRWGGRGWGSGIGKRRRRRWQRWRRWAAAMADRALAQTKSSLDMPSPRCALLCIQLKRCHAARPLGPRPSQAYGGSALRTQQPVHVASHLAKNARPAPLYHALLAAAAPNGNPTPPLGRHVTRGQSKLCCLAEQRSAQCTVKSVIMATNTSRVNAHKNGGLKAAAHADRGGMVLCRPLIILCIRRGIQLLSSSQVLHSRLLL